MAGEYDAAAVGRSRQPAGIGPNEEVLAIHSETRRILAEIQRLQEASRATPVGNGVLAANQALTAQATAYTLQSGGTFNEGGPYNRSTLLVKGGANRLRQSSALSGSLVSQQSTKPVSAISTSTTGTKTINPIRRESGIAR